MSNSKLKGLNTNARSPSSIGNAQHHDRTGTEKDISGSAVDIKLIIPDSTVETAVENLAIIRVFNQDTAPQFLWVGKFGDAPATVDSTNGLALTPQFHEVMYLPVSDDDMKSIAVKSSSSQVQVTVMEV